eukprot:4903777-Lingulodinium_polyedra.AAC.1
MCIRDRSSLAKTPAWCSAARCPGNTSFGAHAVAPLLQERKGLCLSALKCTPICRTSSAASSGA